jgi:phospholipid/cholesterol/gamma-HCH transport system substrate-binding protein
MSVPALRRRTASALLLVLSLLLAGCKFDGAYDLPLPGSPVDENNSFQVTAEFADVLNVVPRSSVMVDDVTVGEVTDVQRIGWHAKITMRIKNGTVLPDNAIADIRQTSLLGEKYVALEAPPGQAAQGQLSDGDNIALSDTGRNPEVEEVLGALSFLLSGGGVGQLATITHELNNVMDGRTDRLRHLLSSLESVIGTIDDQKADIIQALEAMNNLTATLNREKKTIGGALDVMGPAVKVLDDQHDELIRMLKALDRLGVVGTRVIGASKANIVRTLRNLEPVLGKLHAVGGQLASGIDMMVSFPFPKEAANVVKGDYANASIRAGINLSILGQPSGPGLPGPGVPGLPDPGQVISDVQKCLNSGDLASKACQKVLKDAELYKKLKKACAKDENKDNPVCQAIVLLPSDGNGDGLPDLPGVPGVPAIPLIPELSLALSSGRASPDTSTFASYVGGAAS